MTDLILKEGGCKKVKVKKWKYMQDNWRAYIYHLDGNITIDDLINVKIDFKKFCSGGNGFQEWYPCGAVWMGLGTPESAGDINLPTWYWLGTQGPYPTIGDQQDFDCFTDSLAHMGLNMDGGAKWCILNVFDNFRVFNTIPNGQIIEFLQLHVRTNTTTFWRDNGLGSEVVNVRACKGKPPKDWCSK